MIRSFIACDIPSMGKIDALIDSLRGSGAKLSIPKSHGMHITLKFLGDIREDQVEIIGGVLSKLADDFPSFEVGISGVGGFPSLRNLRVLWIGISDDGSLKAIAERIDLELSSMGFPREKREFKSHVTIARVKSRSGIERAIDILREYENVDFGEFNVEAIVLKKSTLTPSGAIYDDLSSVNLKRVSNDVGE